MYTMYQALRVFFYIGCFFIIAGLVPSIRFLFYYFSGQGNGHIQSLILSAIFYFIGFQVIMIGIVADVIGFNRKLIEEVLLRVRRLDYIHSQQDKDS